MSSKEINPEIIVEYSQTFKRIVLTGMYGSISPLGAETTVYSEYGVVDDILKKPDLDMKKIKIKRVIECDLIINPLQMVSLRDWFNKKIIEYEQIFGKIKNIKEIDENAKSILHTASDSSTTS